MNEALFAFVWVLNFAISWFNAWGVGRSWIESKTAGGFQHFVTWCAAVMSACGFTWCYLFILAFAAGSMPYHGHVLLNHRHVQGMLELGYVVIILPVLGSGIGITISSWQNFARERSLISGGAAAWNTFAEINNVISAVRVMPGVLSDLGAIFKSDDDDSSNTIMVALVVVSLAAGALTTAAIVRRTMKVRAMQIQLEFAEAGIRR